VVAEAQAQPDLSGASYMAAVDPVGGQSLLEAFRATAPDPSAGPDDGSPVAVAAVAGNGGGRQMGDETQAPLVKAPSQKLGRNEPCWCGSGRKFKLCHGAG